MLPELGALRGVEQNVFHHRDVHGHTLEVLEVRCAPRDRRRRSSASTPSAVRALLAEPLADELTRGGGMRFAALLHDAAKPLTRGMRPDGRVTFVGHDAEGAELARDVLRRLRASARLADYVAALTRHHLRLGFLVHERPLSRRAVWRYLAATDPYAADVTVFTVADRLATRGQQRRARDRRPPRARARRCSARRSRAATRQPPRAARARRRARARARASRRAASSARCSPSSRRRATRARSAPARTRSASRARCSPDRRLGDPRARRHGLEVDVARDVALRVVVGRHLVLVAGGERGGRAARARSADSASVAKPSLQPAAQRGAGVAAPHAAMKSRTSRS